MDRQISMNHDWAGYIRSEEIVSHEYFMVIDGEIDHKSAIKRERNLLWCPQKNRESHSRGTMVEYGGIEMESVMDNMMVLVKVLFAMSPLIVIGMVLALAREDEEEEKAKKERVKGCKT